MSVSILRGALVNLLSVGLFLAFLRELDPASAKAFPAGISILLIISLVLEPFLTYWKMSAVLQRVPDWGQHRCRPWLVNLFTVLMLWGARFAFFGAMFVVAVRSLFPAEDSKWMMGLALVFCVIREGVIVWCYCRKDNVSRRGTASQEWAIDLGMVFVLGFAEAMAHGLFDRVRTAKFNFPEDLHLLFFQLLFFVMFFVPIRLPYTINEIGMSRSFRDHLLTGGTFLFCFVGLFYGHLFFR